METSKSGLDGSDLQKYYEYLYAADYEKPTTIAESLAKAERDIGDPQLRWVASIISKYAFKVVYDYGCGIGRFLAVANAVGMFDNKQFRYIGVDVDLRVLKYASALADKLDLSTQTVFLSVEEWKRYSALEERCSCIVVNDVLHHLHHSNIATLLYVFLKHMLSDTSLIIAETALLKRIEANRIPLTNEDLQFLSNRLQLRCSCFTAISPRAGLPLTRAVIQKITKHYNSLTVQGIDDILRDTLSHKAENLRFRLNTALLDNQFLSQTSHFLSRLGMLEICESIEYVLSHWSDTGYFNTLPIDIPEVYIDRPYETNRITAFIRKNIVFFIYGDFGVGKSTLLKQILAKKSIVSYAAIASDTADITQLVFWILTEARRRQDMEIESNCLAYARNPAGSLDKILQSLSLKGYTIVIDNAHLCNYSCINSLVDSALTTKAKIIFISSIEPNRLDFSAVPPVFRLCGFTQKQTGELLEKLQNRKLTKKEIKHSWLISRQGNPQLLLMELIENNKKVISSALGALDAVDWDILLWAMAMPGGIRETELSQHSNYSIDKIRRLVNRRILEKRDEFICVHDVVALNAVAVEDFTKRLKSARTKVAKGIESVLSLQEYKDGRLTVEQTKDALRLIALFRSVGKYSKAWASLCYSSYSIYMDGMYDILLEEIERNREASPNDYEPEIDSSLFWLFMRQGRILKRRYQLDDALYVFEKLQCIAKDRNYLAIIKELAEISRLKRDNILSEKLFREAIKLDEKWAKDERDALITKKQLAITLIERGDFSIAEELLHENLRKRDVTDILGIASCKGALAELGIRKLVTEGFSDIIVMNVWIMLTDAIDLFKEGKDIEGLSGILNKMTDLAEMIAQYEEYNLLLEKIMRCVDDNLFVCIDPPRSELMRKIENAIQIRRRKERNGQ